MSRRRGSRRTKCRVGLDTRRRSRRCSGGGRRSRGGRPIVTPSISRPITIRQRGRTACKGNRSRVEGNKCSEDIGPRTYVLDASSIRPKCALRQSEGKRLNSAARLPSRAKMPTARPARGDRRGLQPRLAFHKAIWRQSSSCCLSTTRKRAPGTFSASDAGPTSPSIVQGSSARGAGPPPPHGFFPGSECPFSHRRECTMSTPTPGAFLPSRPPACLCTGVSRPRWLGRVEPLSFSAGAG
jgi:hypothetical protein